MYQIIQKRKIWLAISGALIFLSLASLLIFGLNFGIDFTGGALMEVQFSEKRPTVDEIKSALSDLELKSLVVQPVGESGAILRFREINQDQHQAVLEAIDDLAVIDDTAEAAVIDVTVGTTTDNILVNQATSSSPIAGLEELRFDSVGPTIGAELKRRSVTAVIVVIIAIVLYIAWAFRKVSKPVASWKYGVAAIVALFHDVFITLGVFTVLGAIYNIEINSAFVAAILTVLGYSVNDTIVVFDRIREVLPKSEEDFEGTVNTAVNQSITRSINTSLTTLLVLLSILFFGGSTIRDFVLALSIGIFIGTYSSIFLASPILVIWEKFRRK